VTGFRSPPRRLPDDDGGGVKAVGTIGVVGTSAGTSVVGVVTSVVGVASTGVVTAVSVDVTVGGVVTPGAAFSTGLVV
jgi:hypothetical protein